jgi:hypothetical protein
MDLPQPLGVSDLQQSIHAALRAWHTPGGTPESLLESFLLVQRQRANMSDTTSPSLRRLATSRILLEAIDELEKYDQKGARVLRWRFPDDNTLMMVANKLHVSEYTVSRLQRTAIAQLSDILLAQEMSLRTEQAESMEAQLPPASYSRLIGLDEAHSLLLSKLLEPKSPWTIAIVGLGGIGKTALADAITRHALRQFHFDHVIWLRAEAQTMSGRSHSAQLTFDNLIADFIDRLWPESVGFAPEKGLEQVRRLLKNQRALIVIDNLESETDTAFLMARLNDLADPSKFLLTSRTRPTSETAIFSYSLEELSLEEATDLLHHHAREIGVTELAEANQAEIRGIYDKTGGNPLALKLVASLLDVLPLPQILLGLTQSRSGPIEELYRHIYWQTWQTLSDDARSLLLAMPLVARTGARPEQLQAVTNLSEAQFWLVIQELRNRSLLEVRGSIQARRYGIHRLTETFLRTEIINGPDEAN